MQAMKAYRGVKDQLHPLTSALDGGEWSTSRLGLYTPPPGGKSPGNNWLPRKIKNLFGLAFPPT